MSRFWVAVAALGSAASAGCGATPMPPSNGGGSEAELGEVAALDYPACRFGALTDGMQKNVGEACEVGDVTDCSARCDRGEQASCVHLGVMRVVGDGIDRDWERAARLFLGACKAGDTMGCTYAALAYKKGWGVEVDPSRSSSLNDQACTAGDATGCHNFALDLLFGTGIEKDEKRAMALLRTACDSGLAGGCSNLGVVYEFGLGVPVAPGDAESLYSRSCDGGFAAGCRILAGFRRRFHPDDQDPAMALLDKACSGCDGEACRQLADCYAFGEGVQKSESRAALLHARACGLDNWASCGEHGRRMLDGKGVAKDVIRARAVLKSACDNGDGPGCWGLGVSYQDKNYGVPDPAKALSLFRAACDLSDEYGCASAGALLMTEGVDGNPDLDAAMPLLERACDAGLGPSCSAAVSLQLDLPDRSPDDMKLFDLLDAACAWGEAGACAALVEDYANKFSEKELQEMEKETLRVVDQAIQAVADMENEVTAYELTGAPRETRDSIERLIATARRLEQWKRMAVPLMGKPEDKVRRVAVQKLFASIAAKGEKRP